MGVSFICVGVRQRYGCFDTHTFLQFSTYAHTRHTGLPTARVTVGGPCVPCVGWETPEEEAVAAVRVTPRSRGTDSGLGGDCTCVTCPCIRSEKDSRHMTADTRHQDARQMTTYTRHKTHDRHQTHDSRRRRHDSRQQTPNFRQVAADIGHQTHDRRQQAPADATPPPPV